MQHRLFLLLLVSLAALVGACAHPAPIEEPAPAPAPAPLPEPPAVLDGHQRLRVDIAAPRRYDLKLKVDPRQERFSGEVEIDVDILTPTTFVQLHGGNLDIKRAAINGAPVEVVKGAHGGLLLRVDAPLATGSATVSIAWEAALDEVPESLYRVQEEGRWYAFTQFEPLEAREAFPCFDDPGFKTPWEVTLEVPAGMLAFTNTPERDRVTKGDWTRFRFEGSRPMPSYLVAFAIGELDVVEAPEDAIPKVPLRVITTKGKSGLTKYALQHTPAIMKSLTDYFGNPYPYRKLDLVAVPNFAAGAMENVGLVTFRERLLLVDGDEAPPTDQRAILGVIAHELAHMWFGDLVTMAWWDDLWLNEAFATWMASRVLDEVSPQQEEGLSTIRARGWVMDLDAQQAARSIRQPIEHGGDVYNAFDGITYTKGAAVLRMLEQWMGPEAFRGGVRDYLAAHAHGNATTADLLTALEARAKRPVGEVAATFLDQPGTPLLTMSVKCEGEGATVSVRQSRYLPAGSTAAQGMPWRVPACLRYGGAQGQAPGRACFELSKAEDTWALPVCPRWVHPNADEQGYYLWELPAEETLALATTHRGELSMAERVALAPVLRTLLLSGKLGADTWLATLEALSQEEHWMVIYGVMGGLEALSGAARAQGLRDPYAAYARRLLGPHLKRVGLKPGPKDGLGVRVLRPDLINAMALSQDKATARAVQQQAEAFLKDPKAVPFEIGSRALVMWAREGDARDFDRLLAAFRASSDAPATRQALLGALGNFSDPALVRRALDLLLDGTFRAQDFWSIAGPPMREEALHAVVWDWATGNYERLLALLGDKSARAMPGLAGGFCSAEGRKKAQDFFDSVEKSPGMDRNLALTLERVEQCERLRDLHAERLAAFFKKKGK